MGLRLINSGRVAKFISAAEVARTRTHIFVSSELPAWSGQNHGVPGLRGMRTFDLVEKLERDARHFGVDPSPVRERAEPNQQRHRSLRRFILLREPGGDLGSHPRDPQDGFGAVERQTLLRLFPKRTALRAGGNVHRSISR